jgi:Phage integrase family
MRRWVDKKIITTCFVEWNSKPVRSVKNAFARAVDIAGLDVTDGNVTPHTLRHTAATWLMQRRRSMGCRRVSRYVGEGLDRHIRSSSPQPLAPSRGCDHEKTSNSFWSKGSIRGPLADRLTVNKRGFS